MSAANYSIGNESLGRVIKGICSVILLCTIPASGETNDYSAILHRNAFALRPPPIRLDPELVPAPVNRPATQIRLTGISAFSNYKNAFLTVQEPGGLPQSFILKEGGRAGTIRIVQINPARNEVSLLLGDTPLTLTVENPGSAPAFANSGGPATIAQLTGINVLPRVKWALLRLQNSAGAASQVSLKEGMKEGVVEVLEIDPARQRVKIRNAGKVMMLSLANNDAAEFDEAHRLIPPLPPPDAGER